MFYHGVTKYTSCASIASILVVVVPVIIAFLFAIAAVASTAIFYCPCCSRFLFPGIYYRGYLLETVMFLALGLDGHYLYSIFSFGFFLL